MRLLNGVSPWVGFVPWLILQLSLEVLGQSFPSELSVDEAVELALQNHPALRAAEALVSGSEGAIDQSRRRPNPFLALQAENWRAWGDPSFDLGQDLDLFAYVSQPLERGGKRERRTDVARQERQLAELERDWAEWNLRQRVKLAFWTAFLSQKELSLLRESREFFHQITESHRERVREGVIPEVDLVRVELEENRLELSVRESEAELDRSRIALLREMGIRGATDQFALSAEPSDEFPAEGIDLSQLLARGRQSRIDLRRSEAEVRLSQLRTDLEKARAKPDWDLVLGYKRTAGFDTILGGIVIPLPIFDQNQGNIVKSRFEIDYASRRLEHSRLEVEAEIRSAVVALQRRYQLQRQVEKGLLERARESWQIAQAAFEEGAAELLRLLDAHRSWIEVRLLQNRNRVGLQIDLVNLETAVGEADLPVGLGILTIGGDVE